MYVTSIEITNASPASTQEWIGVVRKESLEISVEANGKASTASMEALINISRDGSGYSVSPQNEITIKGKGGVIVKEALLNPGFSGSLDGWLKGSRAAYEATEGRLKLGCCKLTADGSWNPHVNQEVPASAGDKFRGAIWARTTVNTAPKLLLVCYDSGHSIIGSTVGLIDGGDDWQRYTVTGTCPASTATVALYVELGPTHTSGICRVDDAELYDITDADAEAAIFSGYVSRVEPQVIGPDSIRYRISCQDNTRLLDRVVVASESYVSQTDEYILDDLFSTYLPGITTTGVIGTSPETTLDSITFENLTLRQCIERICDRTGAEWRLGFDDDLKYYHTSDNDGAFDFSDSANGTTTEFYLQNDFGYQEEFSTPANVVTVIGYQPPQPAAGSVDLQVTASADDGMVGYTNAGGVGTQYPPTTSDASYTDTASDIMSLQLTGNDGAGNRILTNCLLRFDTSSIPDDAVILTAKMYLRTYVVAGNSSDLEFGMDYYPSSNWPIGTPGDYDNSKHQGSAGAYSTNAFAWKYRSTMGFGVLATPGNIELDLLNPNDNISKTGYTGFRMYLGSAAEASSEKNTISIFTKDKSITNYRPRLVVTYQEPQPDPVTGSYTDSASVSLYGTFEKTIKDPQATTAAECNARAEIETMRFGYPRKSINCTFDRDGLEVGDTVHFTSSLLGIDDDFVIQRLRMKWPARSANTRYYAELGEARADLIEYLRKLK